MAKRKTAAELAEAWRAERMEFNDALIDHLVDNLGLMPDAGFVIAIGMAVSWCNMGFSTFPLDLPGHEQMTAGEIVTKFGLEPFLESEGEG